MNKKFKRTAFFFLNKFFYCNNLFVTLNLLLSFHYYQLNKSFQNKSINLLFEK